MQAIYGIYRTLQADDYQERPATIYQGFFHTKADEMVVSQISAEASKTPRHVALSEFRDNLATGTLAVAEETTQPVLCITAGAQLGLSTQDVVESVFPQVQYGQLVGSGHFAQVEVPNQVNAMIDQFITQL